MKIKKDRSLSYLSKTIPRHDGTDSGPDLREERAASLSKRSDRQLKQPMPPQCRNMGGKDPKPQE